MPLAVQPGGAPIVGYAGLLQLVVDLAQQLIGCLLQLFYFANELTQFFETSIFHGGAV